MYVKCLCFDVEVLSFEDVQILSSDPSQFLFLLEE